MASNYDDKFLYNLANNLQDELSEERVQKENAQNFASENQAGYANGTIEEGVQEWHNRNDRPIQWLQYT